MSEEEKEEIITMCNDIYEGGDWQPMINYIEKLQKENEEYHRIKKELIRVNKKIYDVDTIDEFIKTIDELQKENQELKEENKILIETSEIYNKYKKEIEGLNEEEKLLYKLTGMMLRDKELEQLMKENYISKGKIGIKIKEYEDMLKTLNKKNDIERIKSINERIIGYKELLGF